MEGEVTGPLSSQHHHCLRAGHGRLVCSCLLEIRVELWIKLEAYLLFKVAGERNPHGVGNCGKKIPHNVPSSPLLSPPPGHTVPFLHASLYYILCFQLPLPCNQHFDHFLSTELGVFMFKDMSQQL